MEQFHQYTYGQAVSTFSESDHKPFETIISKHLLSAPKRLHQMLISPQRYDAEFKYCPSQQMVLDTLNRAYTPNGSEPEEGDQDIEFVNKIHCLPISTKKLQKIQEATDKDVQLQTVKETILNGWPED